MTNVIFYKLAKGTGPGVSPQVYEYTGPKGGLFVVVQGEFIGHKLEKFQNDFYSSSESLFHALKTSFLELVESLSQDLTVGVIAYSGNVVCLTSKGEFDAVLIRGGEQVNIFSGASKVTTVSGQTQLGDTIIFSSRQSMQTISQLPYFPQDGAIFKDFYGKISQEMGSNIPGIMLFWHQERVLPVVDKFKPKNVIALGLNKLADILPKKGLRVHPEDEAKVSRKKRLTMILGIVLFVALLVSIFFGAKRKDYLTKTRDFEDRLTTASSQLEEARSLKDLSSEKARSLLLSARSTAQDLAQINPQDTKLKALQESIDQSLGEIAGLYKSAASLYLDLALVSSGFKAGKVDLSENNLLVMDKEGERLVSVDIPSKKTEVAAGPSELTSAKEVAAYLDRKFVLEDDGIKEITSTGSKMAVPKDWPGEALIKAFAGNLYVLDKSENTIWRYPGSGGTYGAKSSWIADEMKYQFDDSVSWAIDGSIWVLDDTNKISKYIGGRLDSFTLSESGDYTNFYTDAEAQNLYVLDKSAHKVKIFDKKGKFVGEYDAPEIADTKSIVVSEPQKKLLLIGEDKIYQIELKHL